MTASLRAKPIIDRADELLTNPTLRLTKKGPRGWQSEFVGCDPAVLTSSSAGTTIRLTRSCHIDLQQEVRAYPNRRYRLDVHARPAAKRGNNGPTGCIQPCFSALKADCEIRSCDAPAMPIGPDAPPIHRAYFQCPEGTGRLRVRLRIRAHEPVVIKRIRLIECGDYLPEAHPLACPPEPWQEMPPCLPGSVLLCDGRRDDRPLLAWLQGVFSCGCVRRIPPTALPKQSGASRSALVIDLLPNQAPALHDLLAWSDHTIAIVSLQTFAGVANRSGIHGIRLQDRVCGTDMPAATITFAGYHTCGFALADAVPYCWNDSRDDFAHRYLLLPKAAKAQLADLGIHASLVTETGHRETRHHPVAFHRRGVNGALIVMDPNGLEAPSAGDDVPRVFELLWRNALGCDTVTLGQFAAPALHYQGVMTDAVEVTKHFDMIEDLSPAVRLAGRGNPPPTWLWPSPRLDRFSHHKTLFIRTGFSTDDWPAIYGLIFWLKRVALKSRVNDPATELLRTNLRVMAWPVTNPRNWRGCPKDITDPQTTLQPDDLAGLIDLAAGDEPHTVILAPDKKRVATLQRCLGPTWPWETEIVVAPRAFDEPLAGDGGACRLTCKVLLPGIRQPRHANSPSLTDLTACLLERLAFGTFGWIAPNRNWRQMQVKLPDRRSTRRVILADPAGKIHVVRRKRGFLTVPAGTTPLGLQ